MDERRKEPRRKLMAFMPVYDADKGVILGFLGDLTLQGAMVVGERSLERGFQLTLSIEFPADLDGIPAQRLSLPARVARCVPDESPRNYTIGLEFTEVTAEQTSMIEALLERYHFRHQARTTE